MPKKIRKSTKPQEQQKELKWDSVFASLGRIEIVLLVGGVLLLMVLIYTIHSIVSPFLVLGAMLFLLYPLRRYVLARNLMWLGIVLFALWFVNSILPILAPFIVSFLFAYMLNPLVDRLNKWKIARWVSSLVIILLFLSAIALIIFFVLPIALTQFEGVLESLAKLTNEYSDALWNSKLVVILEQYGITSTELRNTFASHLTPRFEDILKAVLSGLGTLMSSISGFITQIFYIALVPFLTFYFLTDYPKITYRFQMLFPKNMRDRVSDYMTKADELVGHYLRGVLLVAALQGTIIAVLFSVIGIKYALLLGLLGALFDLIPYFGLAAILVLSAIAAFFSEEPALLKVAFAVGSIGFLHILEVVFLSPKIVGSKVGLHPLLLILSLLVFMYMLGFVGLLIAVPTTALIILFIRDWEERRRTAMASIRREEK
jgi:predicted PurR-regulated permease PerM